MPKTMTKLRPGSLHKLFWGLLGSRRSYQTSGDPCVGSSIGAWQGICCKTSSGPRQEAFRVRLRRRELLIPLWNSADTIAQRFSRVIWIFISDFGNISNRHETQPSDNRTAREPLLLGFRSVGIGSLLGSRRRFWVGGGSMVGVRRFESACISFFFGSSTETFSSAFRERSFDDDFICIPFVFLLQRERDSSHRFLIAYPFSTRMTYDLPLLRTPLLIYM